MPVVGEIDAGDAAAAGVTVLSMSEVDPYGRPIGEVLGAGFQVPPLLSGWTVLDGMVSVTCLDEDGRSSWAFRETQGLNEEEVIGALTVRLELTRELVRSQYYDDEDEQPALTSRREHARSRGRDHLAARALRR